MTARAPSTLGLWARLVAWLTGSSEERRRQLRAAQRRCALEADASARPHDDRILLALADLHRAEGNIGPAVRRYWQAAQVHMSSCNHLKALAVLRMAAELEPGALFLERAAAQTLERLGRNAEAAEAYRRSAAIAESNHRMEDAAHLSGRAEMLAPKRDASKARSPAPPPAPRAPTATARPNAPAPSKTPRPRAASPIPAVLAEPELPAAARRTLDAAPRLDGEFHQVHASPPRRSPPDLGVSPPSRNDVDRVVAQEHANAFGHCALDGFTSDALDGLAREALQCLGSTQLALDAEICLLTQDPNEAATAQCSAQEIHEIRTKTLVRQAEEELQSILTIEDSTKELEISDFISYV